MVSIYLDQALKNKRINIKGPKDRYRDFVYINDVIEILNKTRIRKEAINNTFNVGSGKKTKVHELIKIISNNLNLKKNSIKYIHSTPDDTFGIYSNKSKIKKFLRKEKFINLKEGIKKQ